MLGHSPESCSWLQAGLTLLLSCPQGQLSHFVQVRSGISSPVFRYQYVPGQQPRPRMSSWPLDVTDHCCGKTIYPDLATSDSTGQDPTMVPSSIASYSHKSVLHYPPVPCSASPLFAHILQVLFFFNFSTTYFLLLLLLGDPECLGSPQEWTQEY